MVQASRIKVSKLYEWAAEPHIHVDNERFRRVCRSAINAERELADTRERLERALRENVQLRQGVQRAIDALNGNLDGRPDMVAHIG